MASVAKWLRQWIVVPPLAGSSPVVRPDITVASVSIYGTGGFSHKLKGKAQILHHFLRRAGRPSHNIEIFLVGQAEKPAA